MITILTHLELNFNHIYVLSSLFNTECFVAGKMALQLEAFADIGKGPVSVQDTHSISLAEKMVFLVLTWLTSIFILRIVDELQYSIYYNFLNYELSHTGIETITL